MWKKWMVLLALFAGALALASFRGGRIAYMLLYLIPALVVMSFFYVCLVLFRFRFYQKIGTGTVVKGDPVDYYFTLRNEDKIFYPGIEVEFLQDYSTVLGMEQRVSYSLEGGEGKECATKLCCNYRGEYAVGAGRFYLSDYLGLFRIAYRVPEPLKVTVLPRVTAWRYEREILEEPEGRVRGKKSRTGEMDISIRAYENGDSLRRVHWKASAKRGDLMSREGEEALRQGLIVFLDLRRLEGSEDEKLKFEDEMMEQAVAMVYACRKRGIPVTVVCEAGGRRIYRIFRDSQWREFYLECGKLCFEATHAVYEIAGNLSELSSYQYAVVLTGKADAGLGNWMRQSLAGTKSSIIMVTKEVSASVRGMFEEAGIGFFTAWIGRTDDI